MAGSDFMAPNPVPREHPVGTVQQCRPHHQPESYEKKPETEMGEIIPRHCEYHGNGAEDEGESQEHAEDANSLQDQSGSSFLWSRHLFHPLRGNRRRSSTSVRRTRTAHHFGELQQGSFPSTIIANRDKGRKGKGGSWQEKRGGGRGQRRPPAYSLSPPAFRPLLVETAD